MRAPLIQGAALALLFAGCSSTAPDYPLLVQTCLGDGGSCPPPTVTEPDGGPLPTGSSSSSSSSSGSGTGGAGVTLKGGVALVSSPTFALATATPYQGTANVVGTGSQGIVTAPYGGSAGTMFDLSGLSAGTQWLLVQDTSGGTTVLSTWSAVTLPSASAVTLPLLDAQTLTQIAATIPSLTGGLSATAAQVVVQVTKGGAPYANVSATSGVGGAVVVYDVGAGTYSATAKATGTGGTLILFNAQLSGQSTVTLTDNASMATIQVSVHAAPGAATVAVSAS
jgi:hypothetical protein